MYSIIISGIISSISISISISISMCASTSTSTRISIALYISGAAHADQEELAGHLPALSQGFHGVQGMSNIMCNYHIVHIV